MRVLVLTIALAFIALLTGLTIFVFVHNGVSADGIIAILILVLFVVGIVGALRHPPNNQ